MKERTSPIPFDLYSRYYDLFYRDKDYSAEVDYIVSLLKRFGVNGTDILEFGSGSGRHGRLLAKRGFQVIGIERSLEMVAQATSVQGFICQQGDICKIQMGRSFDAVLSLFHVLSYQITNESVHSVFDRAAEHLQPGGLFLFDIWYSPAVAFQRPDVRIKRIEAEGLQLTRLAEPVIYPNENRVDVHFTIFAHDISTGTVQTFTENHPMRHFSLPELDYLAERSGFKRICAEAFLSGAQPGEDTWGLCVVLRKI